jgi:hypothetical protein
MDEVHKFINPDCKIGFSFASVFLVFVSLLSSMILFSTFFSVSVYAFVWTTTLLTEDVAIISRWKNLIQGAYIHRHSYDYTDLGCAVIQTNSI